ncbi:MAG: hypothetical protein KatS3mg059_0313 [Thermomicrobiales bacterium]|nr:MAG: hypothetical protein KatS3mg059_0313 [Thermomicrobiales bacterium]
MDGPRFYALACPTRDGASHQPRDAHRALTRRQILKGFGGLSLAAAAGRSLAPRSTRAAVPAAATVSPATLGNPASRVLLPGDAGLHDFSLDFSLAGPPAVFFYPGDTPGWSPDVASAVGGFAFGYASILSGRAGGSGPGRAVQVCVHHGFPSTSDADIAWSSLTAALISADGKGRARHANVRNLDLVEIIAVSGERSILATVAADIFAAVVVASRAGADLVTVAIADFTGTTPTTDECVKLAEEEAKKVKRRHPDAPDPESHYFRQWLPGFGIGSAAASAPFFSWPAVLRNEPVPFSTDTAETLQQRRQASAGVLYQSQIEGPLPEATPLFNTHGLYYSGQASFFDSFEQAERYVAETSARLRAGLPGISLSKVGVTPSERRYTYKLPSQLGTLCGYVLHRLVLDLPYPISFVLHVLAVPASPETKALPTKQVRDRLDPVIQQMGDGLHATLINPAGAPLIIPVNSYV